MDTSRQSLDTLCVLAIDAGGTSFKSALVGSDGTLLKGTCRVDSVDSQGPKEGILSVYETIISLAFGLAGQSGHRLAGIGISTPGPFNVHTGQSLMTHKFQSLYEVDLTKAIREIAGLPEPFPVHFMHDSHAFLMGECWLGQGRHFTRVAGVTLGTGLGFGCVLERTILANGIGGPRYSLFQKTYGKGTLEDRISRRGILKAYANRVVDGAFGDLDVRDIAGRARSGQDPMASSVFIETAKILLEFLEPVCNELRIECLLFGGQISKSYDLIQPVMEDAKETIPTLQWVGKAARIEESPLLGAGQLVFSKLPEFQGTVPGLKISEI